jgi:nicotinamidase-related amidase
MVYDLTRLDGPALMLVDIQKGFGDIDYWGGQRNNPDAERRCGELLGLWREQGLPICHIQHCSTILVSPLHASNAGNAFQDIVIPRAGEVVLRKQVNSAFIGTDLQAWLVRAGIRKLVIAGLTTDHCISTTARMSGNLGFETFVVADATATFNKTGVDGQHYSAELIHDTALASLSQEFAQIVTSEWITHEMINTQTLI